MTESRPPRTDARSRWAALARKPVALAAAGALGLGLLGGAVLPDTPFAAPQSQTQSEDQTLVTPYGQAPLSFSKLVKKVKPAVVSIHVKNGGGPAEQSRDFEFEMPDLPEGHPLREFFERFKEQMPKGEGPGQSRPRLAQGSGFIISEDGYVVSNHHVVQEASDIRVTMDNGDEHKAKLVGSDQRTDLALLKIEGGGDLPHVEFAEKAADVGDWVLAVGNPFGLGGTVTAGIISAHNRDIGSSPYDYLQIDAAVNRGNSGGPAFNLEGKVVGVNTAIFSPSGGNVGIAFAVPATLAMDVVMQLKEKGKVSRGWLGVTIQNVSEDIAASLAIDEPRGAMVTKITEDSPAANSNMEVGDVILQVEDQKIENSRDLARKIASYSPGETVSVTVLRDGSEQDVSVELGQFPNAERLAAMRKDKEAPEPAPAAEEMKDLGMSLAPAASQDGAGGEGVVIVDVNPDSSAADKGLKAGDVILEVAGVSVSSPNEVADNIRKAKDRGRKAVHMLVRSGDQQRFVALPLKKA